MQMPRVSPAMPRCAPSAKPVMSLCGAGAGVSGRSEASMEDRGRLEGVDEKGKAEKGKEKREEIVAHHQVPRDGGAGVAHCAAYEERRVLLLPHLLCFASTIARRGHGHVHDLPPCWVAGRGGEGSTCCCRASTRDHDRWKISLLGGLGKAARRTWTSRMRKRCTLVNWAPPTTHPRIRAGRGALALELGDAACPIPP